VDPEDDALEHDALEQLDQWVAEVRVDDAVEHRRRAAWLRRQAAADASVSGMLADLAEHRQVVMVHTSDGRRHLGRLFLAGLDVVGLRTVEGGEVLLALEAVTSVQPQAGSTPVTGERAPAAGRTLRGELRRLHEDRSPVLLVVQGGRAITGTLTGVGVDVLTVSTSGGGLAYVPLGSVAEVSTAEASGVESG
jgi:hypothetical protein